MSNAQRKGKRDSSGKYRLSGNREKNKARRIARDKARAKPMNCGHGSRHKHPIDGLCRVCFAERQPA